MPATGQAYVAAGDGIAVLGDGLTLTAFALGNGAQRWQVTPAGAAIKGVTSYDNANGRTRWYRAAGENSSWREDGQTRYVAESAGGYLASSPVTVLDVINLRSGDERTLDSPLGQPFSGTLAMAAAVPEGADPVAGLIYLTSSGSALTGVDPLTGEVKASVSGSQASGSAAMYVVRGGVALGLDSGANGAAWGYSVAAGRVIWVSPLLPWPHYFSDLSGLGGSADLSGDVVLLTACPKLAASAKLCADPELVAFTL